MGNQSSRLELLGQKIKDVLDLIENPALDGEYLELQRIEALKLLIEMSDLVEKILKISQEYILSKAKPGETLRSKIKDYQSELETIRNELIREINYVIEDHPEGQSTELAIEEKLNTVVSRLEQMKDLLSKWANEENITLELLKNENLRLIQQIKSLSNELELQRQTFREKRDRFEELRKELSELILRAEADRKVSEGVGTDDLTNKIDQLKTDLNSIEEKLREKIGEINQIIKEELEPKKFGI